MRSRACCVNRSSKWRPTGASLADTRRRMNVQCFGDKTRFAIEVGEFSVDSEQLRRVDVWAAGQWLTFDDNHAFVPHFAGSLQHALGSLLTDPQGGHFGRPYPDLSVADNYFRLQGEAEAGDNRAYLAYRFMAWGPTTDNVSALLFREGGTAFVPFSFWRADH